jgi:DNA-directed RNA polymerase subunit H (RpoH/RPB5)
MDLLLERALHELIPIHKLENTCEKIVLLKNIKAHAKAILRTQTYDALAQAITLFDHEVNG